MIVIKGKNQKSKVLENLIRKNFMTDNVLVVDSIGFKYIQPNNSFDHIFTNITDYAGVIKSFKENYNDLKGYDWIVFYVNASEDAVTTFKELDREYPQNFIVTIQGDNSLTSTYYI